MIVTQEYLESAYDRFNRCIFAGRLPRVALHTVTAKTFLGNCRSHPVRRADGVVEHRDLSLRISRSFDLSATELDSVIVHEMIHVFIMVNNLPDTGPHGELFTAMMNNINRAHGLQITIRGDVRPQQRREFVPRWRVVARMRMTRGGMALKVLPRVRETILHYRDAVLRSGDVRSIELFLSRNPFFARYPSSGALKVYPIDEAILDSALADAEPVKSL